MGNGYGVSIIRLERDFHITAFEQIKVISRRSLGNDRLACRAREIFKQRLKLIDILLLDVFKYLKRTQTHANYLIRWMSYALVANIIFPVTFVPNPNQLQFAGYTFQISSFLMNTPLRKIALGGGDAAEDGNGSIFYPSDFPLTAYE